MTAKVGVAIPLLQSAPVSMVGLLCFTTGKLRHMDINETSLSTYVPGTVLGTRVKKVIIPILKELTV